MSARIQVTLEDDQARKALDNEKKAWEANKKAVTELSKEVGKSEKKQTRAAESIIKKQRTRAQVLGDNIKALRANGRASEDGAKRSNAAIRTLIAAYKEEEAAAVKAANEGKQAFKDQAAQIDKGVRKVGELKAANMTLDQQYDQIRSSIKAAFDAGELEVDEYKQSLVELQGEQDRLRDTQKKSFGSGASQSVATYAKSFLSISAAIGVVTKAIQFFNEEKEKALGQTETLQESRRSLRQVSKGDFDELEAKADDLTKFGLSREKTRGLVFDARSNGFEDEVETVAAADPVVNIKDGAAFAGEFRKFFADDNLSIENAFNTALAGAAESKFNISELLPQVQKAAQGALAGGESSDVVAATAVLASDFDKSTGDRLRALGTKLATNDETQGLNLIEAVEKLAGDDKLKEAIIKDSAELKAVFAKFTEKLDVIKSADKRIESEQQKTSGTGLLPKAVAEAFDKTTLSGRREIAFRESVAADARNKIATENEFSESAAKSKSAFLDSKSDAIKGSIGQRLISSALAGAASSVTSDESTIGGAGKAGSFLAGNGGLNALPGVAPLAAVAEFFGSGEAKKTTTDQTTALTAAMDRQTDAITSAVKANKPVQQAEAIE